MDERKLQDCLNDNLLGYLCDEEEKEWWNSTGARQFLKVLKTFCDVNYTIMWYVIQYNQRMICWICIVSLALTEDWFDTNMETCMVNEQECVDLTLERGRDEFNKLWNLFRSMKRPTGSTQKLIKDLPKHREHVFENLVRTCEEEYDSGDEDNTQEVFDHYVKVGKNGYTLRTNIKPLLTNNLDEWPHVVGDEVVARKSFERDPPTPLESMQRRKRKEVETLQSVIDLAENEDLSRAEDMELDDLECQETMPTEEMFDEGTPVRKKMRLTMQQARIRKVLEGVNVGLSGRAQKLDCLKPNEIYLILGCQKYEKGKFGDTYSVDLKDRHGEIFCVWANTNMKNFINSLNVRVGLADGWYMLYKGIEPMSNGNVCHKVSFNNVYAHSDDKRAFLARVGSNVNYQWVYDLY